MELMRRDEYWHGVEIPREVLNKTPIADDLFHTLRMLPHDLNLAYGWDLDEFLEECREHVATTAKRTFTKRTRVKEAPQSAEVALQ